MTHCKCAWKNINTYLSRDFTGNLIHWQILRITIQNLLIADIFLWMVSFIDHMKTSVINCGWVITSKILLGVALSDLRKVRS